MQTFTDLFNIVLGIGSIGLLALIIILLASRFIRAPFISDVARFISRNKVASCFAIVLAAVASSLIYSNVIGYTPCDLCIWQRIFIYPQLIILFIALTKKFNTKETLTYVFWLSLAAGIVALYNTIIMFVGYSPLPCSAVVSCTTRYVFEFGFITIPTMSLIALIALITIAKHPNREQLR